MTSAELARYVDHTLLKADAKASDIEALCQQALEFGFYSVCVNPSWIERCSRILRSSQVQVCSVIGFPLGANSSSTKAFESAEAIALGAQEIDMVMHIGLAKSGRWSEVEKDINAVVKASNGVPVKVILETCLLTDDEKKLACAAAENAGAQFVKTSTGFSAGGAAIEDVKLMRSAVSSEVRIKASGGIRDLETFQKMISAGAHRIGTSSAHQFLRGLSSQPGAY